MMTSGDIKLIKMKNCDIVQPSEDRKSEPRDLGEIEIERLNVELRENSYLK